MLFTRSTDCLANRMPRITLNFLDGLFVNIRKYVDNARSALPSAARNFIQKANKFALCLYVFIIIAEVTKASCFVSNAGGVKPFDFSFWDEWPNIQGLSLKFSDLPQFQGVIMDEIVWLRECNFSTKSIDVISKPFSLQSGLDGNRQPGNNQPSRKGDSSHPTGYINWGELWHKINTPSIKWSWTRFILVSLMCFLAGGVAGVFAKLIWPARVSQGNEKDGRRKPLKTSKIKM